MYVFWSEAVAALSRADSSTIKPCDWCDCIWCSSLDDSNSVFTGFQGSFRVPFQGAGDPRASTQRETRRVVICGVSHSRRWAPLGPISRRSRASPNAQGADGHPWEQVTHTRAAPHPNSKSPSKRQRCWFDRRAVTATTAVLAMEVRPLPLLASASFGSRFKTFKPESEWEASDEEPARMKKDRGASGGQSTDRAKSRRPIDPVGRETRGDRESHEFARFNKSYISTVQVRRS